MSGGAKLISTISERSVEPSQLSSGEKVIFGLFLMLLGFYRGHVAPKLILLDEVDASLHPSMIKAVHFIVNEVVIKNGGGVIFATHSPTTVALSKEMSVHLLHPGEVVDKISRVTRPAAISELSEGFATFESLLSLRNTTRSKVILSEGHNYRLINKALEIFNLSGEFEAISTDTLSDAKLYTIYEFISSIGSKKTFFFVWDFDYQYKITGTGMEKRERKELKDPQFENCRPFIFEYNPNSSSQRGIENLFDELDTADYTGIFGKKGPINKKEFTDWILRNATTDLFKNFLPLVRFLRGQ